MNSLDPIAMAVIAAFAIVIVAIDIYVRLKTAPDRKDRFILSLLDQLMEPSAEPQLADEKTMANPPAPNLQECLLRHFERSSTSRQILSALSEEQRMNHRDLLLRLNQRLDARGKPPLPLEVARRVATILLHTGFVALDQGALRITEAGRELDSLLRGRREARLMNGA